MDSRTDFKAWWQALTDPDRERIACAAGTTVGYVTSHLIYRRKRPQVELMKGLAAASDGAFTYAQLLAFFYADPAESADAA